MTPHPRWRSTTTAVCLLALLGSATLAACGKSTSGGTTSPDSTATPAGPQGPPTGSWNLVSYTDARGVTPAAGGNTATLRFGTGGALDGTTGCNSFRGTFTVSGDSLGIQLGPMTQMACTDPAIAAQEQALLTGLPGVGRFQVREGGLTLSDGSGAPLFEYQEGIAGLGGTTWRATGVNNGRDAVESTALTEKLTAAFGTDSKLTGSGGCNTFTADYTTSGDSISVTALTATEIGCQPDVMALEMQYFTALQAATTFEVTGNVLTLRDEGGAMQVVMGNETP